MAESQLNCPHCHQPMLDQRVGFEFRAPPTVDIRVCTNCAGYYVMEQNRTRPPVSFEHQMIARDPQLRRLRDSVLTLHRQKRRG
jgi:hypothetical protein